MKNAKKLLTFLLIISLVLTPLHNNIISATNLSNNDIAIEGNETTANNYNKIHFYLGDEEYSTIDSAAELTEAINSLTTNSSIELASINSDSSEKTTDTVNITVQFESDFMQTETYLNFKEARETIDSIEKLRSFRQELNEYSKEYHYDLVINNLALINNIEYISMNIVEYSPCVVFKVHSNSVDIAELESLSYSSDVEHISVGYAAISTSEDDSKQTEITNLPNHSAWKSCLKGIDATDIIESGELTGEGIYIGIYETSGICDVNRSDFSNLTIETRAPASGTTSNISIHANNVLCVLSAIAPNATYYVGDTRSDDVGIEWFIEKNVDIVNCSLGLFRYNYNPDTGYSLIADGYRQDIDGIYDYQISAHFITVVCSSGNYVDDPSTSAHNPDGIMVSPAYAYNAITVGGVIQKGNSWIHAANASYTAVDSETIKPNVAAPYSVYFDTSGSVAGTSFSSPIVAGCIALLLENDVSYSTYTEAIMSVVMATAQETSDYVTDAFYLDEKVGAGMVNLTEMMSISGIHNLHGDTIKFTNSNHSSSKTIKEILVTVEQGTPVTVALTWCVPAILSTDSSGHSIGQILYTDYDLGIYDSNGDLVTGSYFYDYNTEFVRFTATESATYTISVYQYSQMDSSISKEYLAISYDTQDD